MKNIIRIFRKLTTLISPKLSNSIMYFVKMKKKLNLKNPKTFNEKINYLKIYNYPNNEKIIKCSDKYLVREYIKEKKLDNILVKFINKWDKAEDINFKKLPNKFVLKCNHGCAYNILCRNKKDFDQKDAIKKLNKWMKEDFGLVSGERHYSKIERKIICEEYLEDDIIDYKFFCFKGVPKFFYVGQNINGDFHNMQTDFFYPDGQVADFYRTDHKRFEELPVLPKNLNKMLEIAAKLAEDFEFVRVDLYNVNGKIYLSELTFSPCSGFMPLSPAEYDLKIGEYFDIDGGKND